MKKTITFFMIVTNRDVFIASHAIRSFGKLVPVLDDYHWKLVVHSNCLKPTFKTKYFSEWSKYHYVEIVDNIKYVDSSLLVPGTPVISDDGCKTALEGRFERGCAIWTREFREFETDYWVTVDADFEILSGDFIIESFRQLEDKENLVVLSSDHDNTHRAFDSYSNEYIVAMKRYHTWFCIYKKKAQSCRTSHFYYEEKIDGERYSYDDAAKFQHDLVKQYGFEMNSACNINPRYYHSFIHYGAFSKNVSLDTQFKVDVYRRISILARRGFDLFDIHGLVNHVTRILFSITKYVLYTKARKERGKLHFYTKLDVNIDE